MGLKRKSRPLAPPPKMPSRRKARKLTTQFHQLTCERDEALAQNNKEKVALLDRRIEEMGGRKEYQKASQVSTSFHSTSKWVLGHLARNGWLYGVGPKRDRRPTRLLEVGAINTELWAAGAVLQKDTQILKYKLQIRAVDLHSMHPGIIEEADFLTMPVPHPNPNERYDVLVNSMVLNCVTAPEQRGEMLARMYHFLRPGGLCFVTLPRTCLNLSPYMDSTLFKELLEGIGLTIVETKESPKIAFFLCRKSEERNPIENYNESWGSLATLRQGKKFRNNFAVVLKRESVEGTNLTYEK